MVWMAVVAVPVVVVSNAQESAHRELEGRFGLRATVGARFVQSYVDNLFRQQQQQAIALLSGAAPSDEEFELVTSSLGYRAAVLLDEHGRALNVVPPRPSLIGEDLTVSYEHLRQAVAGHNYISSVVPSAADGVPIVAFAVPFDTPTGRRVFSGGFDVSKMPFSSFLASALPFPNAHAELIADDTTVIASAHASPSSGARDDEAALAHALGNRTSGHVDVGGTEWYVAGSAVPGTAWRLVLAVTPEALNAPLKDDQGADWLLVVIFALGGLIVAVLAVRLSDATRARRRALADISAREDLEGELTAARDAAVQASELKSQFLANTSHEIRTPLTVILGINELLGETDLDATQQKFVQVVERAGANLLSVVNDILDFAKMEATGVALDVSDFEIRPLVDGVVGLFHDNARAKGIELLYVYAADLPSVVSGDPRRLRQILLNLASNAVKFTDQGTVEIIVSRAEGGSENTVRFEIVDTGIGIPATDQHHLFEPFVQVDGSDTRRHGGTGLGLAISAQLAKSMDSTIFVDSSPDAGSRFWFEVALDACPLSRAPATRPQRTA
jgi:signal transduction histidine kinase